MPSVALISSGSPCSPVRQPPRFRALPAPRGRATGGKSLSGRVAWRNHGWEPLPPSRGDLMSGPLKALSDEGVAIWLDDLSRDRLATGGLAQLVESRSVVGVTTNPSIFQAAITGSHLYAEQVDALAAAGAGVDAVVRAPDHGRRPRRLRPVRPGGGSSGRGRRPGLHRGRSSARARHGGDRRPGPRAVGGDRPAEPAGQDPGDDGRPARDPCGDRRGHQRQRHADLLPRALSRRDGGLHRRARGARRPPAGRSPGSRRSPASSSAGSTR